MGLLDDAIREHMELKRLRGADPSEVAREEWDVLGRVPRREDAEEPGPANGGLDHGEIAVADRAQESYGGENAAEGDPDGEGAEEEGNGDGDGSTKASSPERGADFANVGQETAELDMRTVLDEQHEAADRAGQIDSAGLGGSPGEEPEKPAGTPGEAGEPVEDVLEETPDFLRDTPEQERLWFEQQPPRDFDFDK